MIDTRQLIADERDSVQRPATYMPYTMPSTPQPDAFELQKQLQERQAPGTSGRIKVQQVDPNSILAANQALGVVRDYNQNAYQEAIKRVADSVAENIKKSEKTSQLLQGTAYEGNPFFAGVYGKNIDTSQARGFQPGAPSEDFSINVTPLPVSVDKKVDYMAPPKYEPKFNTIEVSAKKDQEKDRGSTGPGTPRNDLYLEKLDFNQFTESGTTKKVKGAENPTNEYHITPTYLMGRAASIGDANITTIDGRSFSNNQFDVAPEYTEWTDGKYKQHGGDRTKANRPQKLTGPKAADVLLGSTMSKLVKKGDGVAKALWGKLEQRITKDGNFVFRATAPTKVANTFKATIQGKEVSLPLLTEESATQKQTHTEKDIMKLYENYLKTYKDGNPDDFTTRILTGQIRPTTVKDGQVVPTGGMYNVGLQSEFNNKIYELAYDIGKQMGLKQQDPGTLTDALSREDQFKQQVRGIADQLRALLLGQPVVGGYSSHDINPEPWEGKK